MHIHTPHTRTHCQAYQAYKFRVSIAKDCSAPGRGTPSIGYTVIAAVKRPAIIYKWVFFRISSKFALNLPHNDVEH